MGVARAEISGGMGWDDAIFEEVDVAVVLGVDGRSAVEKNLAPLT